MADEPEDGTGGPEGVSPGPITREELYGLVWSQPMTPVAAKFGLTRVALAKWCQKLRVPRPGRGHWARVAAGYKVKKLPLRGSDGMIGPSRLTQTTHAEP